MEYNDVDLMLTIVQHALSIGLTIFSTTFLIPNGILFIIEWKQHKKYMKLATGTTFIVLGVEMIVFLMLHSLFGHLNSNI
jgi:quinol-cytochrome oxidoreductase complex cytochrome b subunit